MPVAGSEGSPAPVAPDTPENRLAAGLRRLIDLSTGRLIDPEVLDRAAAEAERLADELEAAAAPGKAPRHFPDHREEPMSFFPTSALIGWANPIAAPAVLWRVGGEDGRPEVRGSVRFGYAYEGPPSCVHGGVIAGLFDEVLGAANVVAGKAGMTGTLTVRFRKPTPLLSPLELVGRQVSVEGRKIRTWAGLYHEGVLTAEADGLFLDVRPGRLLGILMENAARTSEAVADADVRAYLEANPDALGGGEGPPPR